MVRTAIVTVIAVCLTLVLLSFGMFLILRTTEFGKVMMGDFQAVANPWKAFMAGQNLLFFYLELPITLVVSFLAAFFTVRLPIVAGTLGSSPVWAVPLVAGDLMPGFILVASAVGAVLCATYWQKNRMRKSAKAFAATHSN
jgi:hypothetical protein